MQRCDPGAVGVRVAQGCAATNAPGGGGEGWEERVSVAGDGQPGSGKGVTMAAGQAQVAGAAPAGGTLLADFLSRRKGGQQTDVRRARLRPALGAAFRAAVREEIERGRGLIWAAFVFAGGIAVYFALPAEPMAIATIGVALAAWLGFLLQAARGREATSLLVLALLLSGMAAGATRTALVAAPVLDRARSATVTGLVENVEHRENGLRLVLRLREMSGVRQGRMPARVRISLRGQDTPAPTTGDTVRLRARLMPPAPAVMPGGYDFAFRAYFDGIGASGFAFGGVEPVEAGAVPWDLRASAGIERLRSGIAGRIRAALGDTTAAALAVALITGDRSGIPPDVTEALRTAGLAHILAISGLHMALFAGSVFFVLRALFALSSRLAQDWPIDVWAAGAALAAAAFYLAISGGSIATQRAFVMIALVLAGRLFGRRALTLRNAGVAMLLILAATPEALVDPGFQMSFAAVIALIAAYEEMTRRRVAANRGAHKRDDGVSVFGLAGGLVTWFGAILLTSLIAGAATGAIGAYHFHRIAPLGPLVNLVAMPVVTIAVMPFAVLALALVPFGLEALPLVVMGVAVDQVVAVSQWAASLTPGEGTVGAPSVAGTVLAVLAGTMACLAPRGFRRVAIVPLCLSAGFYATHRQPDILVSANGTTLALRDAGGALRVTARPSSFIAEVWLRADGVGGDARARRHLPKSAMSCDPLACLVRAHGAGGARPPPSTKALQQPPGAESPIGENDARSRGAGEDGPGNRSFAGQGTALRSRDERETVRQGRDGQGRDGLDASTDHVGELATGPADRPQSLLVSIVRDPAAFAEDCARVDMIVSAHDAPAGCAAPLVLDRARLARDGTTAIYLGEASNGLPVTAIVPSYTRVRPWTPRSGMAR